MARFDAACAAKNLSLLVEKFEEGSSRFPEYGHYLVEAPPERRPENESFAPESQSLARFSRAHVFREVGPPARTHYHVADPGLSGEDVEAFRILAGHAARIVEGWPADVPGLPPGIGHPFRTARGVRGLTGEAETWMLLVHRVAWTCPLHSPLRADVSTPDDFARGVTTMLPYGHPAENPSHRGTIEMDIPSDCFISSLMGMNAFEASAWAIRAIVDMPPVLAGQAPIIRSDVKSLAEQPTGLVPAIDMIEEVFETLWAFVQEMGVGAGEADDCWWAREDYFLPLFIQLGDALRAVRPHLGAVQGWPHPVMRGLRRADAQFGHLVGEWGWAGVDRVEEEREGYIDARLASFREELVRPYYEAAISWQDGWERMEVPPEVDRDAETGRGLGFVGTMTPEAGRVAAGEARERLKSSPRLGSAYTSFSESRRKGLSDAFNEIMSGLKLAGVGRGWRPLHVIRSLAGEFGPAGDSSPTRHIDPSPLSRKRDLDATAPPRCPDEPDETEGSTAESKAEQKGRGELRAQGHGSQTCKQPSWNAKSSELTFGVVTVKFKKGSFRICQLINAFEKAAWAPEINNPFQDDDDSQSKLAQTIKDVNSKKHLIVRFSRINCRVTWKDTAASDRSGADRPQDHPRKK